MRSLQKDPALRFNDAREFEAALEACVPEVLKGHARGDHKLQRLSTTWTAIGTCALVVLAYAGYRVASTAGGHGATPLVTAQDRGQPAPPKLVVTENDDEEVMVEGPGPANVAIRSDPEGATVFRNGQRLGETPLDLLVQPEQELVRIELRKDGFQPLAAELTARDGERLLTLTKETAATQSAEDAKRPSNTRSLQVRRAPPPRATANANKPEPKDKGAATTPAPKSTPAAGPYERFE